MEKASIKTSNYIAVVEETAAEELGKMILKTYFLVDKGFELGTNEEV